MIFQAIVTEGDVQAGIAYTDSADLKPLPWYALVVVAGQTRLAEHCATEAEARKRCRHLLKRLREMRITP